MLLSLTFINFSSVAGDLPNCFEKANTQKDLNQCASNEFKRTKLRLQHVYKTLQDRYRADPKFIQNLKESQRAWDQYKNAQLRLKFPDAPKNYGHVFGLCVDLYLTELMQARIHELESWLNASDGDVCAGSRVLKQSVNH
jgi:uncharacterized protein YecT (DUF1311 family)